MATYRPSGVSDAEWQRMQQQEAAAQALRGPTKEQVLQNNLDALRKGDYTNWQTWNAPTTVTQSPIANFGGSKGATVETAPATISIGKIWMPDANDPAAKYFTADALKNLYLVGGGSDGGAGRINVGSVNDYLGQGAKDYLMSIGLEGADDDKHKLVFMDPTKEYWGANAFKDKAGLRRFGEGLATAIGGSAAIIGLGAAAAGAAGSLGAGAGAGTGTTGGAGGLGFAEMPTSLGGGLATPNFGAVVSPYAAESAATAGAGWGMSTPTSLGEVGNTVGWTDAITGGSQAGNLVNAGGGLGGLVDAGMGIGGSGYGLIDAVAGAGTSNLETGLWDKVVEKLKDPKNIEKVKDLFGGNSNQSQKANALRYQGGDNSAGGAYQNPGPTFGSQWFDPNPRRG